MEPILSSLGPAPNIAILRGGGFGDFLTTTPALRALRSALPEAEITLITRDYLEPLVRRYRLIDRILLAPPYPGVVEGPVDFDRVEEFFTLAQHEKFDLALQWHGGGANSNPFIRRLGARWTAGFFDHDAARLDYGIPYDHHQHEILRYLDLLALLGIEPRGLEMDLPIGPDDIAAVNALGSVLDLEAWQRGDLVGVNLGAGGGSRRWAPERFAEVVSGLTEEFNLPGIVVLAPRNQSDDARRFTSCLDPRVPVFNLAGRTSLEALIGLISRFRLLLTNDSGPSHMAIALATPSVTVYGGASPVNWGPLSRTWHRIAADWSTPCRYLSNDGCGEREDTPCLLGVSVETVYQEASQILMLQSIQNGQVRRKQTNQLEEWSPQSAPEALSSIGSGNEEESCTQSF